MRRYLVTHTVVSEPGTQEDWLQDWLGLRQRSRRAEGCPVWLMSFYAAQPRKLYCEWEAERAEDIRSCFTDKELNMAPIVAVEEIVRLDPTWLDE
jgi:hypothetical protein